MAVDADHNDTYDDARVDVPASRVTSLEELVLFLPFLRSTNLPICNMKYKLYIKYDTNVV